MASNAGKRAVRARMKRTGERYNVARRALEGDPSPQRPDASTRHGVDYFHAVGSREEDLEFAGELALTDPSAARTYLEEFFEAELGTPEAARVATMEFFEEWGMDSPYRSEDHRRDPDWGFGIDPERDGVDESSTGGLR